MHIARKTKSKEFKKVVKVFIETQELENDVWAAFERMNNLQFQAGTSPTRDL